MLIQYFISIIIGYFLGCFSTAYFVGKLMGNIDIREHGSGNAGATNMIRVLGTKAGVITFFGDGLKGALSVLIGIWIGGEIGGYCAGVAVVVGHNWPVFLKFRGGKGIAASVGTILVLQPAICVGMVAVGVLLIAITRYVSLASIGGAVAFPVIVLLTNRGNIPLVVYSFLLGGMAILQHRHNIQRLIAGRENKLGRKK